MTGVSVLRSKFVPGWPRHSEGERVYVRPLAEVLERSFTTDAHFAAYRSPNGRRLTREALDAGIAIEVTCIVFDVDGPDHSATEDWRRELREKVSRLAEVHPNPYYYETRGGARIVYRQEEPTVIRSQEDAREWSKVYAVAVSHLERRFGIVADSACADWQRLYRLPRATRDEGGKPENWPTFGNANAIGSMLIEASHADVDRAKQTSKAFNEKRVADFTPSTGDGFGVLYYLLRGRGDIVREHGSGSFVVRCPREREHTCGRTGDGSTLLYLPARGEQIGAIHCLHGHCAGMTVREWLRCFSDGELDAARRAAGIKSRRAA